MKHKLGMVVGLTALSIMSNALTYGQHSIIDLGRPASLVLGLPQMGAEVPDPTIRILRYGENRTKRVFSVGEALNIGVENSTGAEIWYIRRTPPGVGAGLLGKESIRIERLVNNKWLEALNQYSTPMDDPDGQFAPKRHRIDPDITVIRKWTPQEPGQYRVMFYYYADPKDTRYIKVYSQPFKVNPK